jgi:hypothetical protein
MSWTRRDVLKTLAYAVGAAALSGCDPGAGATSGACTTAWATAISENHGHDVQVSADDLAAAADKTYEIQGTADHTHEVTLTAAELDLIARGNGVTVTSTEATSPSVGIAHTHSVTVGCHSVVAGGGGGGTGGGYDPYP